MMEIKVNFDALRSTVTDMGAEFIPFNINGQSKKIESVRLEPIHREVLIEDIEWVDGKPTIIDNDGNRRNVLLYIPDHSWMDQYEKTLKDPSAGKKVHFSRCSTIKNMEQRKRYERYVATSNEDGKCEITNGAGKSHVVRLDTCQSCLRASNASFYKLSKKEIKDLVKTYSYKSYFESEKQAFHTLPNRKEGDGLDAYPSDWAEFSQHYRARYNWTCEKCYVNLESSRSLLHLHHINGVKGDNKDENLKVLCVACHSEEPSHSHMFKAFQNDIARAVFIKNNQGKF